MKAPEHRRPPSADPGVASEGPRVCAPQPGRRGLAGAARPGDPSAASGHAQWRRRPRIAQSEARGGEAGGADARAAAEGTGGRRRGGDAGGGAAVAVRPQGARGAAAAAAPPLGSVSGAGVRGGRAAGAGSRAPPAVGRAAPAPPRRHGPPPRASAGTRRGNPRASSRPSLSDPRFSGALSLHPIFPPLCPRRRYRFSFPLWQRSHHPPFGSRRPAPQICGPHRRARRTPRAPRNRRAARSASSTAACPSRIRWPGTCTGRTKWVSCNIQMAQF